MLIKTKILIGIVLNRNKEKITKKEITQINYKYYIRSQK